ncbi:MAG: hypothetical protein Q8N98_03035, partial [bacterium]|nr:hypothetical protein [bacterium]
MKIPKFLLYGKDDPTVENDIQPQLALRQWSELSGSEKKIALQELINNGWVKDYSNEILDTIEHLNHYFLRQCPGKKLHAIPPKRSHYDDNKY